MEALQGDRAVSYVYVRPFMQMTEKRPTRLQARDPPKDALRHFHPLGEPTHLPASHTFCSRRTYLQGKIPQVTSPAENSHDGYRRHQWLQG